MPGLPQETAVMAPDIRFYIVRGSVMVPLVPVDQLPFPIRGIPCQLTRRQMSDEDWKYLKSTNSPTSVLSMEAFGRFHPAASSSTKPCFFAPDHVVRVGVPSTVKEPPRHSHQSPLTTKKTTGTYHSDCTSSTETELSLSLPDSFASIYQKDARRIGYRKPNPSGIEPDPSKKEYCTHWIKTGDCAFVSVGCRYKHEMPNIITLRGFGFMQVPAWWKEKTAISSRGPTWIQRRLAAGGEEEQCKDDCSSLESTTLKSKLIQERNLCSETVDREHSASFPESQQKTSLSSEARPKQGSMPLHIRRRETTTPDLLIDLEDAPAQLVDCQKLKAPASGVTTNDIRKDTKQISSSPLPPSLRKALPVTQSLRISQDQTTIPVTKLLQLPKQQAYKSRVAADREPVGCSVSESSDDDVIPVTRLESRSTLSLHKKISGGLKKNSGLALSRHATADSRTQIIECRGDYNTSRTAQQESNNTVGATKVYKQASYARYDSDCKVIRALRSKKHATKATKQIRRCDATGNVEGPTPRAKIAVRKEYC